MRQAFTLIFFLSGLHASCAQDTTVIWGPPSGLDAKGWSKVLLLDNGNTLFINLVAGENMHLQVYDSAGKMISRVSDLSKYVDMNKFEWEDVLGCFTIDSKPVIFIRCLVNYLNTLVCISFNKETGKVESEKILEQTSDPASASSFIVVRNYYKTKYAVAHFQNVINHHDRPVTVSVYDGNHNKLKSAAYYFDPALLPHLNSANPLGLYLDKANTIYLSMVVERQLDNGLEERTLQIMAMPENSDTFMERRILIPLDHMPVMLVMQENLPANTLRVFVNCRMLINGQISADVKTHEYVGFLGSFTLNDLNLYAMKQVNLYSENMEYSEAFASPQSMIPVGNTPVMLFQFIGEGYMDVCYTVHDLYIREFDDTSLVIRNTTIPLLQYHYPDYPGLIHDCWRTQKGIGIVCNAENDTVEKDGHGVITRASALNNGLKVYQYKTGGGLSERTLFMEPMSAHYRVAMLQCSDYEPLSDRYATVICTQKGSARRWEMSLLWTHLLED